VSALDWAIVGAFLAASLVLGLYLTRRASGNTGEYFLSGRNLPWWLAGTSMVATSFSADTPLYVTSLVRGHGVYENWQWWCFALSGMLAVSFFSRLWRRAGVVTDVELIDLRYSGRAARFLRGFKSVYFSCIIHTIIKAQVILAMVKILDVTLGWGKWESVIASSLVTLAYSTLGGLWGVVLTDFVQFILAMVGSVALAVVAVDKAGGLGALHAQLPPDVLSFFPPVSDGEAISTAFMAFLGYMGLSWWSRYSWTAAAWSCSASPRAGASARATSRPSSSTLPTTASALGRGCSPRLPPCSSTPPWRITRQSTPAWSWSCSPLGCAGS
jgi:Na+/proline symporter